MWLSCRPTGWFCRGSAGARTHRLVSISINTSVAKAFPAKGSLLTQFYPVAGFKNEWVLPKSRDWYIQ